MLSRLVSFIFYRWPSSLQKIVNVAQRSFKKKNVSKQSSARIPSLLASLHLSAWPGPDPRPGRPTVPTAAEPTDRADRPRRPLPTRPTALEPTDRADRRGADRTRRRTCKISRSKIARRFRARLSQRGTKPTGDFVSADFTRSSARSVGSTATSAVGRLGHGRLVRRRSGKVLEKAPKGLRSISQASFHIPPLLFNIIKGLLGAGASLKFLRFFKASRACFTSKQACFTSASPMLHLCFTSNSSGFLRAQKHASLRRKGPK